MSLRVQNESKRIVFDFNKDIRKLLSKAKIKASVREDDYTTLIKVDDKFSTKDEVKHILLTNYNCIDGNCNVVKDMTGLPYAFFTKNIMIRIQTKTVQ